MFRSTEMLNFATVMLKFDNINIRFDGKDLVKDLSFAVKTGEIVCICGESGCGKSSLLKAALGFIDVEGKIFIDGEELTDATIDGIRRKTAYVPQELALPHKTIKEMAYEPFLLKANSGIKFSEEKFLKEWKMLGLDPKLYQKNNSEISGGQRQRITLAIAGMLQKKLLLLDEPTSALDEDSTMLVLNYLHMLASQRQMAILVVSHSTSFANGCDKVINIKKEK